MARFGVLQVFKTFRVFWFFYFICLFLGFCCYCFAVLEIKPRTLYELGKPSATELYPSSAMQAFELRNWVPCLVSIRQLTAWYLAYSRRSKSKSKRARKMEVRVFLEAVCAVILQNMENQVWPSSV
jgi:hypothetical protein